MPTNDLVQVVAYIKPALKKKATKKIEGNGHRITMSAYIEGLMRKDLDADAKSE